MSTGNDNLQAGLVINRLLLAYTDKNYNRAIVLFKKIIITNQLVKNLPTLMGNERKKLKDQRLNNFLDIALRLNKLNAKRSVILAINKIGSFL